MLPSSTLSDGQDLAHDAPPISYNRGVERGLLAELTDDARASFESLATRRQYPDGATLFFEGDPSDWVLGIVAGQVKVSALTDDGREVVLAVCGPGESLGELSAIDGRARSATATAMGDVEALLLTVDRFEAFLDAHPAVARSLLRTIAERLRDADRREVEFAALDSVGRVAARLVDLVERFGVPADDGGIRIELAITQEEIAGWTGCSGEAASKALAELRRLGLVATARRSITVVDCEGLRTRSGL